MYASVLVEIISKNINKTFTYEKPDNMNIQIGIRVQVPFGKQIVEGFVVDITNVKPEYETKKIIKAIDTKPVLNEEMLELGKYISNKTLCTLTNSYQTMLPKALKAKNDVKINKKYVTYIVINKEVDLKNKQKEIYDLVKEKGKVLKSTLSEISISSLKTLLKNEIFKEIKEEVNRLEQEQIKPYKKVTLNEEQQNAVNKILKEKKFKPFLLHGVTGSGKTEVYMHTIDEVLKDNKEVIVLVPEISLTPQLTSIFRARFNDKIAILHSGLSDGERYDEWRKIEEKKVNIVVGARSAIFAPFTNLGLIIIDEEHSSTYKQENIPAYSTIDIAIKRAKTHNAMIVLGSATPSIESYTRAKVNVYELIEMKSRVNKQLPTINIVDMKDEIKLGNRILSSKLKEKIKERLENKEQVIILLNRRGYVTTLTCHNCGETIKCPNCDIPLVNHKVQNKLKCHYCNYEKIVIDTCPKCKTKNLRSFGFGTEKLEELINLTFGDAKVIRMDVDTTTKKGAHAKIIKDFENHEYDILIGTQMIAKGLDFKDVTLVGVINGDASLNLPDYKSAERTYQLLNQVAGRSGRSTKKGEVVIQVFNPDHYSIRYASLNDYKSFYETEMSIRKKLNYPPFSDILVVRIQDKSLDVCLNEGEKIVKYLKEEKDITVLGPTPALIPKINNIYNVQIIVKYKEYKKVIDRVKYIYELYRKSKIKLEVEFNPNRL